MTDHHRRRAEYWLDAFLDNIGPVTPTREDMLKLAHIHALLALSQAPPATTIREASLSMSSRVEQIRDALAHLCASCARTDDDLIHNETDRDGYHPFEARR